MKCIILLIGISLVSVAQPTYAGWLFGPANYEDCVIDGLKGINNEKVARQIRAACQSKFSAPLPPRLKVPLVVVHKIEIEAGVNKLKFGGKLYNGDGEWSFDIVTVRLECTDSSSGVVTKRDYNITPYTGTAHTLGPFATATFRGALAKRCDHPNSSSWSVVGARGRKKEM